MYDILKAMAKEKEYIFHRTKGQEPFHLIDAIKECGFVTLADYFNAKIEYNFDKLNFSYIEKKPAECIDYFFQMMDTKETGVVFIDSKETFVFSGESKPYNEEYCNENNIPVYPLYTKGGAIVSTIGDFSIGICFPEAVGVGVGFILSKLKNIFSKYIDNVTVNGNDLLLNGKKICGSIMYHQNDMKCFACHFSFKDNSELIEKICNVSGSIKTPTYINGLTVDIFKNELKTWLNL
jgi:lipoate-protein ligase A